MSEHFEKIVDEICKAIKSEKRDTQINKILGQIVNPSDLKKLENELRDFEVGATLYSNDPVFKDWVKGILEKYLK
jgi:hypothetical protein